MRARLTSRLPPRFTSFGKHDDGEVRLQGVREGRPIDSRDGNKVTHCILDNCADKSLIKRWQARLVKAVTTDARTSVTRLKLVPQQSQLHSHTELLARLQVGQSLLWLLAHGVSLLPGTLGLARKSVWGEQRSSNASYPVADSLQLRENSMGDERTEPTTDELAGLAWWNDMPDAQRAHWAKRAGTGVAADAWALFKAGQYRIGNAELREAVANAAPSAKHLALMTAIRQVEGFQKAKLVRVEDIGTYLMRRKVLRPDGSVVHDDVAVWLTDQLAADAGQLLITRTRTASLGLCLSKTSVATLRVIVDRGGDEANVVQVTVEQHTETLDRRLFDSMGGWGTPRDFRELLDESEGPELAPDQRRVLAAPTYHLREVVDIAAFVREAQILHHARMDEANKRRYQVTDVDLMSTTPKLEILTGAEIDPNWDRFPCRERRVFQDWALSSAGRSGARLCDHWTFQLSDGFSGSERYMSFVTEWATTRKLAEIKTRNLNDYELFGKLQALDARLGVPFAWFFFMLHGNPVHSRAGERVLAAAEAGTIVLPEHDYRVLKNWSSREYGF